MAVTRAARCAQIRGRMREVGLRSEPSVRVKRTASRIRSRPRSTCSGTPAHRRLPGWDLHPLRKRSERPNSRLRPSTSSPRHDAPGGQCYLLECSVRVRQLLSDCLLQQNPCIGVQGVRLWQAPLKLRRKATERWERDSQGYLVP